MGTFVMARRSATYRRRLAILDEGLAGISMRDSGSPRSDVFLRPPVIGPQPLQVPGLHLALALHLDRPPSPADELVPHQLVRRAGDLDLARRAVRLHPVRRIHRI